MDRRPFWTRDERSIYFESNRNDLAGTQAGNLFHIYRMTSDGRGVFAVTGPLASPPVGANASQSQVAVSSSGSSIVYIETTPGNVQNLETDGSVDIVELNLSTGVTKSLVRNNPQGFVFTGLNNPQYGVASGGNIAVYFAGRLQGRQNFNLFAVDTQSGRVTQITTGIADDRNPTLSPTDAGNPFRLVLAFDSNRSNPAGTATKATRDIWVVPVNAFPATAATRVTNFSVGGTSSNNIEPAWSTNKIDEVNGPQSFVNGRQLIAFASTRRDSANDGNADSINPNGTSDIYWLEATVGPDAGNPGSYTVLTPESALNAARKLPTSDSSHQYDDRKPAWPQFIETYRVAYDTNRTAYDEVTDLSTPNPAVASTPRDIFASTLIDIYAPTLIRFNEVTQEIVSVEPRLAQPGSDVRISVKMADFESGIRDVWVQIKNPNSKYQSSDGQEHKVYIFQTLSFMSGPVSAINTPIEWESQRIFIGSDPADPRVNTYARPTYIPSIDDYFAFSGGTHPPVDPLNPQRDTGWLRLNLVSRDPATGVSTYSATWRTPPFPSDYLVDVIAYDNAVDPFTLNRSNWKIYDNVWGFSTQGFNPQNGVLFVSDHAQGQKFFSSRFGLARPVNVLHTFWGTESWMTDFDVNLLPRTALSGGNVQPLLNVRHTLGARSYGGSDPRDPGTFFYGRDSRTIDGTTVENGSVDVPATQQYDIWRIQCRGPVPDSVLQFYAPRNELQPPDTVSGEASPRTVLVAPRAVIWHAPYTGNVFSAPGTLTELATQNMLSNFIRAGGRLLVNGQDIAWALTLNGALQNSFLRNDLRADFRQDSAIGVSRFLSNGFGLPLTYIAAGAYELTAPGAGSYNPIVNDPWRKTRIVSHHNYPGPPVPPSIEDFIYNPENRLSGGLPAPNEDRTYGCPGNMWPDMVVPLSGAVADFNFANGLTGVLHYEDTTTNARVVYAPMGLEGYVPQGFTVDSTVIMKSRRTSLVHNALCWMRTGQVIGNVRDLEGAGTPLKDVLVRLIDNYPTPNAVRYTALTDASGNFFINGVEAGTYEVSATRAGFLVGRPTAVVVHGHARDRVDIRMTAAEPAVVRGKVTRMDGTTPVVGATLTLTEVVGPGVTPVVITATSDVQGNYSLDRVPAGTRYTLTCTAPSFGESTPLNYPVPNPNDPNAGQRDQLVVAAKTYTGFDFRMKPEPGSATGRVVKDESPAEGIAGAVVTATLGGQTVTAITDATGNFSFNSNNTPPNGLDPGTWSVVATAPGRSPNSPPSTLTIVTGQNSEPDPNPIRLRAIPPGVVSGLVTNSANNQPLAGVLVQIRDAANNLIASMNTFTPAITDGTGYTYNWRLTDVPAGVTYTVTAALAGYTPTPLNRTAAVVSQQETKNVNFSMQPLHTFSGNLSLVSAPYDYPNQNVGDLLGIPAADRTNGAFLFATWLLRQYSFYPQAPTTTFRLGQGYWLAYRNNLPLATEGILADQTRPFDIGLNPGWNMIGNPFPFEIDWTRVGVRLANGTLLTYQQAVTQGKVGAAIFGYVSGSYVLDFRLQPWRGYWVRAYEAVTLLVDPITSRRSATLPAANSRAILQGGDGWTVNLRVAVGGVRDDDNHFGQSSRASDGFDAFKAEKPPLFGEKYVYGAFDNPNWGDRAGAYAVDVRSAAPGQKVYEFSVRTNVEKASASISWPNTAAVRRNVRLTFVDLATGERRDMRSSGGYTWVTGEGETTRRFRIEVGAQTNDRLIVSQVSTRTGRSAQSTTISYALSGSASVKLTVISANGTTVRNLSSGSTRAAGIHEQTWDQKNDQGIVVPAGSYAVIIEARSADGSQTARAAGQVLIVR
jgi:hypothetical protein